MKKILSCALVFIMCMAGFAACGKSGDANGTSSDTVSDLVSARNYLSTMYKDQTEATPADYTVVGVVNIGGTMYNITWTADHESVKIIPGDNKMVTVDIDEQNPEEVTYVLTATLSDAEGKTESCSFTRRVPAAIIIEEGMSYADIVDAAYALEDGMEMEGILRLYGTVTEIDTEWNEEYQNITVIIAVAGREDKPIMCYRLAGEGAKDLAVGDAITVEGAFKNYKGTIEYAQGCVLVGYGEHKDYTALLEAAYSLEEGLAMNEPSTMSGVINKIDTAWNEEYQNITVIMTVNGVEDKPIMCYRLKGEGAKDLAVGDYITVTGTIKNYKGTIEFDAGCTLDNVVKAAGSAEVPAPTEAPVQVDPTGLSAVEIVDAAYALENGESFSAPCTLTGVIISVDNAYNEQYGNVTVTIEVEGKGLVQPFQCYRLKGDGAATIAVGDTITVTGIIKNYKGTIEFDAGCTLDSVVKAAGSTDTPVAAGRAELNANDVPAGTIEAAATYGSFTIVGNAEAAVTVDGNNKKSDSGLEFTQRIKLGGSGSIDNRHVSFTTAGPAVIVVYAMSSSGSEDRPLLLMNAEGVELGRGTALGKVEDSTIPVMSFEVPEAGTYYLWSEKSGINIYYISVE